MSKSLFCLVQPEQSAHGLSLKWAILSKRAKSEWAKEWISNHALKSDRERIAPVALNKRATVKKSAGAIHSFSLANRSFAHKKRAIRLKNRWANSQTGFKKPFISWWSGCTQTCMVSVVNYADSTGSLTLWSQWHCTRSRTPSQAGRCHRPLGVILWHCGVRAVVLSWPLVAF